MAGDERTGVSIMRLTAGLDSGPVCLAAEQPIGPADDYGCAGRAPAGARRGAADRRARARSAVHRAVRGGGHLRGQDRARRQAAGPGPAGERAGAPGAGSAPAHRRPRGAQDGSLLGVRRAALAQDAAASEPGCRTPSRSGCCSAARPVCSSCSRSSRRGRGRWRPAPTYGVTRRPGAGRGSDRTAARSPGSISASGSGVPTAFASGSTPAHTARSRSGSSSIGPPLRILAEASSIGNATTEVGGELVLARLAHLPPASGDDVLHDRLQRLALLTVPGHRASLSEQHHRAVVGGVVHRRTRQHEAVDERDRQAGRGTGRERLDGAGAERAVAVDDAVPARVQGGDHERLAVLVGDAQVREQRLVEDRVDHIALVTAPLALAPQAHAVGGGGTVGWEGAVVAGSVVMSLSEVCNSTEV